MWKRLMKRCFLLRGPIFGFHFVSVLKFTKQTFFLKKKLTLPYGKKKITTYRRSDLQKNEGQ